MSVTDFLQWLASGLGANVVFSYLAERWPWFQAKSADAKTWLSIACTAVIAIGAYATLTYVPSSFWTLISPYWMIVVGAVGMYLGTQFYHNVDKTSTKG
jgi:hypothetical protein